ncbi:MAG: TIGR00725 family protein [Candidatus Micrarchaeota archaeon]|nr:TIGR00725 family protein [Candidatus Micrarchaeota archaeon]MDE1847710.1 TIGR00725 family protein [Candidatus Micrarchaeota archaeon]MDE1864139.1 TIGR00725 family protein [Candidatus Micrarchaeota archaeon]
MRKLQIGVMGSVSDLKYSKAAEKAAEELGYLIANSGAILFFGAEKDYDSLSTAACRGAKRAKGTTVGVTYGKHKNIWQKDADVIIPTGLERGGGRELVLVLACDAIISISGGSGTLTEMAIAYQADIPMVALKGYGGWSDELAGRFFDGRRRRQVLMAKTPKKAVDLALAEAKRYVAKYGK